MMNGAKCEKGDPTYDWVYSNYPLHREIVSHIRSYEFNDFVEEYKIWLKCKHIILPYPLDDDEEDFDESEDGTPLNWVSINIYEKLFKDPWVRNKTRFRMIIDLLEKEKEEIINEQDRHMLPYEVHRYDNLLKLVKEWIKQCHVGIKKLLIKYLPLHLEITNMVQKHYLDNL
jgi:hypothetical protein